MAVTPKVIIEGDRVVLVMGTDRLEMDAANAHALRLDLQWAVGQLKKVQ